MNLESIASELDVALADHEESRGRIYRSACIEGNPPAKKLRAIEKEIDSCNRLGLRMTYVIYMDAYSAVSNENSELVRLRYKLLYLDCLHAAIQVHGFPDKNGLLILVIRNTQLEDGRLPLLARIRRGEEIDAAWPGFYGNGWDVDFSQDGTFAFLLRLILYRPTIDGISFRFDAVKAIQTRAGAQPNVASLADMAATSYSFEYLSEFACECPEEASDIPFDDEELLKASLKRAPWLRKSTRAQWDEFYSAFVAATGHINREKLSFDTALMLYVLLHACRTPQELWERVTPIVRGKDLQLSAPELDGVLVPTSGVMFFREQLISVARILSFSQTQIDALVFGVSFTDSEYVDSEHHALWEYGAGVLGIESKAQVLWERVLRCSGSRDPGFEFVYRDKWELRFKTFIHAVWQNLQEKQGEE